MGQNKHSTKMCVVHHNTLSDSFRVRIVWFQPKQDSDRIQISFFQNRIGWDSKNPLSDHLCSRADVGPDPEFRKRLWQDSFGPGCEVENL